MSKSTLAGQPHLLRGPAFNSHEQGAAEVANSRLKSCVLVLASLLETMEHMFKCAPDVGNRDNLQIFEALVSSGFFRPRVVSVGYDCAYKLDAQVSQPIASSMDPDEDPSRPLASIGAIYAAAARAGYSLLAVVDGQDVFLVQTDLLKGLPAPPLGTWAKYTGCREGDKLRTFKYIPSTRDGSLVRDGQASPAMSIGAFEEELAGWAATGDPGALSLLHTWQQRTAMQGSWGSAAETVDLVPLASSANADAAYVALLQTWGRTEAHHGVRVRGRVVNGGGAKMHSSNAFLSSSPHGDPALQALLRQWGKGLPAHDAIRVRTGSGRRSKEHGQDRVQSTPADVSKEDLVREH